MVYWIHVKHTSSSEGKEIWGKFTVRMERKGHTTCVTQLSLCPVLSLSFSLSLFLCHIHFSSYCCGYKDQSWVWTRRLRKLKVNTCSSTQGWGCLATAVVHQLVCWAAVSFICWAECMQSQNGDPMAGQFRNDTSIWRGLDLYLMIWSFHHFLFISKHSWVFHL